MTAPTHRLGGVAAGMITATMVNADLKETAAIVAVAILGSLLPDIDNRNSSISCRWRMASGIVTVGQMVIRGLSRLLPGGLGRHVRSLIGHRGITHSLLAVFAGAGLVWATVTAIGAYAWRQPLAIAMGFGILSHILLDMLAGGAPLLMPVSTRRVCVARIKTGGATEWMFRAAITMLFIYFGLEKMI